MNLPIAATIVSGALATTALAQEDVHFTLSYAHAVLSPGEHQTISVMATFTPGYGGIAIWNSHGGTGQTGTVCCFANAIWDIISVANGETGTFSNPHVEPSLNVANIPGLAAPGGNWIGITDAQIVWPGITPDTRNPIPLFTIDWAPADYLPRTIIFDTRLNDPSFLPQIALSVGLPYPGFDDWSARFGEAGFSIIPAPATATLGALGGVLATRRRRR